MYLAADYWRKRKIEARIVYASAAPAIFGIKAYQEPLTRVIARYGIETKFHHNLVAVDGPARTATFANRSDAASCGPSHPPAPATRQVSGRSSSDQLVRPS
jgi:hypothetical protein